MKDRLSSPLSTDVYRQPEGSLQFSFAVEVSAPLSSTDRAFQLMERWGSGAPERTLHDVAAQSRRP